MSRLANGVAVEIPTAVLMFSCVISGIEIQNVEVKEHLPICRSGESTKVRPSLHEVQSLNRRYWHIEK